jgi:DNA-binding NarL/FixJ family response regulator
MQVLIVDDDAGFTQAAATLVEGEGHEVVGRASSGREGVALAAELEPHVVLMDLDMPIVDGLDATREIVARLHGTRVVVVSGSDVDAHILGAHAAGAVAHVRKSHFVDRLPGVLRDLAQDIDG